MGFSKGTIVVGGSFAPAAGGGSNLRELWTMEVGGAQAQVRTVPLEAVDSLERALYAGIRRAVAVKSPLGIAPMLVPYLVPVAGTACPNSGADPVYLRKSLESDHQFTVQVGDDRPLLEGAVDPREALTWALGSAAVQGRGVVIQLAVVERLQRILGEKEIQEEETQAQQVEPATWILSRGEGQNLWTLWPPERAQAVQARVAVGNALWVTAETAEALQALTAGRSTQVRGLMLPCYRDASRGVPYRGIFQRAGGDLPCWILEAPLVGEPVEPAPPAAAWALVRQARRTGWILRPPEQASLVEGRRRDVLWVTEETARRVQTMALGQEMRVEGFAPDGAFTSPAWGRFRRIGPNPVWDLVGRLEEEPALEGPAPEEPFYVPTLDLRHLRQMVEGEKVGSATRRELVGRLLLQILDHLGVDTDRL